jgi:Flp pilus assembly protein TadG
MLNLLPFRRRHGQKSRQKSRGQSLVEFALVLPVFLVFLAAALDLGRVFYANISLNNAAREGAFEASKHPDAFGAGQTCDGTDAGRIVCRVQFESQNSAIAVADGDISATCSNSCNAAAGSTITVNVRGSFQLVTPILSAIFGGQTVPLHSAATAQIEYYPTTSPATPPPAPVADFTGGPATSCTCASLTVNFTDLSSGDPTAWTWNFGDGTTSTEQNPTHAFTPGTWTVSLTAINATDSSTRTRSGYIRVNLAATPTPTPTGTVIPTPTATPVCGHPPNVIGQTSFTAQINIQNAGFTVDPLSRGDLTTGPKKVQAQNPDATQCLMPGTPILIHWRPS